MMIRCLLAALALATAVAGCADLRWTRPGADAASTSRDLDDCRAAALGRANAPVSTPNSLDARSDGVGRPGIMTPATGTNERFVAEHEEIGRCMHRRGYELRPAS